LPERVLFVIFTVPGEKFPIAPPKLDVLLENVLFEISTVPELKVATAPPEFAEVLLENVHLKMVAVPTFATAPPRLEALLLPVNKVFVKLAVPSFTTAPPLLSALLLLNILFVILSVLGEKFPIAPPKLAWLVENVLFEILTIPELIFAIAPPEESDLLLENVHLITFNVAPSLKIAPPGPELKPFTKDRSLIVTTVVIPLILKILELPPPLTVNLSWSGPLMVRVLLILIGPVKVIVPDTAKTMVSPADAVLIASRSEPGPLLSVFMTVIVGSLARSKDIVTTSPFF
ncbi:MAG: hypothetical protein PHG06_18615, partial [Parabacteroides sp.]|nr:hypothetical protein [Parabacteroides sp.]